MIRDALGLSKKAIKRRRGYVCAGDAKPIMEGNWNHLWRIKHGLAQEEDISDKLAVNMGSYTEPFNLAYCEQQTGREIAYYSDHGLCQISWYQLHGEKAKAYPEFVISTKYPFMACNLDGMWTSPKFNKPGVVDAKHVGQFRYDELVERYIAAMTHQAIVCDVDCWALSVFVGNGRWELIEQEVDVFYREELIEKEQEFWGWVERNEEPLDAAPTQPPKPQPRLRSIPMPALADDGWGAFVARNNWAVDIANAIQQFAETEGAHKSYEVARGIINKTLPDDVGELSCPTVRGRFTAKRTTAGSLVMKMEKDND
jgi:hypothetical protein